jgi:hypothetical protein
LITNAQRRPQHCGQPAGIICLWDFCSANAAAELLFPGDLFHDLRPVVVGKMVFDVLPEECKAITD